MMDQNLVLTHTRVRLVETTQQIDWRRVCVVDVKDMAGVGMLNVRTEGEGF